MGRLGHLISCWIQSLSVSFLEKESWDYIRQTDEYSYLNQVGRLSLMTTTPALRMWKLKTTVGGKDIMCTWPGTVNMKPGISWSWLKPKAGCKFA